MTPGTLLRRNLAYYWRTNLAVVAGVAVTVAVLAGALLVGDSVRASLRDLFFERLGNTSYVVAADHFFREKLAADLQAHKEFRPAFQAAVPLIALEGLVTHEKSGRRASSVQVYGVDERFWEFHGRSGTLAPHGREVSLSEALAQEFGAAPGDAILVRVQKPSDIPLDSLHGRKNDLGRTLRLTLRESLPASAMGEFSIRPQQGAVRAVFVSLSHLEQELKQNSEVNTILVSETAGTQQAGRERVAVSFTQILREKISLDDFGLRLRLLPARKEIALESDQILISDSIAEAANRAAKGLNVAAAPVFTYLATTIRIDGREIPYPLISAIGIQTENVSHLRDDDANGIWLNDWAEKDLAAHVGDKVTLEFLVWEEGGRLHMRGTDFILRGSIPAALLAQDSALVPNFPGISDSLEMSNWNPPFPIDLKRIRPKDEEYWRKYRTAPKAMIGIVAAQNLWQSRFGKMTSIRLIPDQNAPPVSQETMRDALLRELDPLRAGFAVIPARAEGSESAQSAVNFSEYFVYFSFFLVLSGVLLTGLFFKLGVEQRLREIGMLRAVGFPPGQIGGLFFREGVVLAFAGTLLGLAGAVGYAAMMMYGLRTWWSGAVGTTLLRLHIVPTSLLLGGAGGIIAALLAIWWTLRSLRASSPRSLLSGTREEAESTSTVKATSIGRGGFAAAILGIILLLAAAMKWISQVLGFFGAGASLLGALVCFEWAWLAGRDRRVASLHAHPHGISWLGFRNASWRPGRSLLGIALIASASFVIVAVDAFRREVASAAGDRQSGTGGYSLLAETLLPIPYDPNTGEGRENLNFSAQDVAALEGVRLVPFRVRPGDDASCLNLYQPRNPKILGVPASFAAEGRFAFQDSVARTSQEKQNPWRLLDQELPGGVIPAIVDANSMTYILRRKLGDDVELNTGVAMPIRLRLVAALADSVFQSELLVSESNFLKLFPNQGGFRFFLIDAPPSRVDAVSATLETSLSDFGVDAMSTAERLATFHRVENTYISTFQALGGLGLLLGTVGLAAVLLRNVLERRRELAVLRAVGFRPADLVVLVVAENLLLLAFGLFSGIVSALLAIAPALAERGAAPSLSLWIVLVAVPLTGLAASLAAVTAVVRMPLLAGLRAE